MASKRLVSVDIGNVNTRARSGARSVIFPSVVAFESGTLRFDGFERNPDYLIIEFEGERLALGQSAFRLGRMPVTDMGGHRLEGHTYRQLIGGALTQVIGRSASLAVVASLPVQFYNRMREEMRLKLAGNYTVRVGDKVLRFELDPADLHIVPEGFGALCSIILDDDGCVVDPQPAEMRIGVVDAGGRTTDYLMFDQLELVPVQSFGRDKSGMSVLWKMLDEQLQDRYGRTLDALELDRALHEGFFQRGAERIAIHDEVETAALALADMVTAQVNSEWDGGHAVELLAFVGGGSEFIFEFMPWRHKLLVGDQYGTTPVLANVQGGHRFGLLREFDHA